MNIRRNSRQVFCLLLAVILLLIFCAVGHDCHHDQCPVCMLTASFKLTLGAFALMFARSLLQQYIGIAEDMHQYTADKGGNLVALKVKLSD